MNKEANKSGCNGNCDHCVDEDICDKTDDDDEYAGVEFDEYYDFGVCPDEDFDDFCDDEYLDGDFDYDDMQGYV